MGGSIILCELQQHFVLPLHRGAAKEGTQSP